jgi:RNA polymerase sigma factor (sigma-70 family)
MDDLIKLVRTYRLTAGLAERIRLAEEIFRRIEPDLRVFVFSSVSHDAAKDALQEVLKAVAVSLKQFKGDTVKEFWGWCYRIARNKLNDQFRKQYADRMQPLPPDEIWQMMEGTAQDAPLSPAIRHDLDYAIKLLTAAKPECSDLLWRHYVIGLDYAEIAEERNVSYDNARMKIGRCLSATLRFNMCCLRNSVLRLAEHKSSVWIQNTFARANSTSPNFSKLMT